MVIENFFFFFFSHYLSERERGWKWGVGKARPAE
jgi:hypothetical protein